MKTTDTDHNDELFALWQQDCASDSPRPLKEWIARYPDHADSLTQWACHLSALKWAEEQPLNSEETQRANHLAQQVVAEMRARYTVSAAPSPLTDLLATAKKQGYTLKTFARHLNIGASAIAKLQDRLFQPGSIPNTLISQLADALHVGIEQVRNYLQQPPTLAAGAMYKANGVPQVGEQEVFAQAVQNSLDMTDAQKSYWLERVQTETDALPHA